MNGFPQNQPLAAGMAAPGFEQVRHAFEQNFRERGEQGAACAVYLDGRKVVDLWGGYRCHKSREPWTDETMVLVFSVSKGMAATAMAVAHAQGLFDLDETVASYWPEFAQCDKQAITVRQLLTHQAGLVAVDKPLSVAHLADLDHMAAIMASQRPAWTPGIRHGYHTLTLGWYQNELIRRVDPHHRSLGRFFRDEVARRLGVDFHIGLPESIPSERVANVRGFHRAALLMHLNELPAGMVLAGIWPRSLVARSVRNLRLGNPADIDLPEYRRVEMPSANGIGQARAIAKIYSVLATGGRQLGITPQTWRELVAPVLEPESGTRDAVLKLDTRYSFGFSRPSRGMPFGSDASAFGCPGAGGSFGMADPAQRLGFAYVTNKMAFRIFDDPREHAVRKACYECLQRLDRQRRAA